MRLSPPYPLPWHRDKSAVRPLEQLPDQRGDPPLRRDQFVHDGEMIGARNLLVSDRQSVTGAMTGEIRGLFAQERQFGAAGHQRQRLDRAALLQLRGVAA